MSDVWWEPTPGQCLTCGGRGGWWTDTAETRTVCPRCHGGGWDPARNEPWFRETIAPLQQPGAGGDEPDTMGEG